MALQSAIATAFIWSDPEKVKFQNFVFFSGIAQNLTLRTAYGRQQCRQVTIAAPVALHPRFADPSIGRAVKIHFSKFRVFSIEIETYSGN